MRLSSIVLSVAGFVYALLGFLFLFAPVTMGRWILLSVPSAAAAIEIRAFYGGLEVGLGAFLLYCGNRPATVIVGLVAMTLCTGGILVGRLTGIFLDGSPEKMTLVSMIVELFTTVTGILLLMDE
ncbi:MAG: DUF4345 domain-containing protein, partial [Deltaproteobacteria bacterium]